MSDDMDHIYSIFQEGIFHAEDIVAECIVTAMKRFDQLYPNDPHIVMFAMLKAMADETWNLIHEKSSPEARMGLDIMVNMIQSKLSVDRFLETNGM